MPDSQHNSGGKLQSFRAVLEALIVAALIWTGSSLLQLKTQTAVVQSQLASIQSTLADVPGLKLEQVRARSELDQLRIQVTENRSDLNELRKLRGLR